MRILILALAFITTSVAVAQNSANTNEAFVAIPRNYTFQNKVEITNMPAVRSQDSIGICGAFAVAAVLDYNNCRKNNWDCKTIGDDKRVSTLDLARNGSANMQMNVNDLFSRDSYKMIDVGVHPAKAAAVATKIIGGATSEACAPFSAIVNRYNDSDVRQVQTVQDLEKKVDDFTEGRSTCIECIVETIKTDFPGVRDLSAVRRSLEYAKLNIGKVERDNSVSISGSTNQDSIGFELFLKELTISSRCDSRGNLIDVTTASSELDLAPENISLEALEKFISEKLTQSKPVIVSGLCLDSSRLSPQDCESLHALVIKGEATRCHPSGKPCSKSYLVHNSWGDSWQRNFDGGWVSAPEFIRRVRTNDGVPALSIR
ncbi:MAG: hypothetical protein ACK5P6_05285 [Pseudobdellovibrionaceae bacterium]